MTALRLQWMRFAYGLEEGPQLACALEQLRAHFGDSEGSIEDLLVEALLTAHFRTRLGAPGSGVVEGDPLDGEDGEGGEPDEPEPGGTLPGLEVSTQTDSTWAAGRVRNTSQEQLEWRVRLTIIGTIADNWSSVADGGEVSFVGADWNRSIGPTKKPNLATA